MTLSEKIIFPGFLDPVGIVNLLQGVCNIEEKIII